MHRTRFSNLESYTIDQPRLKPGASSPSVYKNTTIANNPEDDSAIAACVSISSATVKHQQRAASLLAPLSPRASSCSFNPKSTSSPHRGQDKMVCGIGENKSTQRKLVLLGDGACGKTSLLNVFTRGYFPTVYEPTVFENYVHDIFVDGTHIELSLWDTAGQEEFDRLRSLSYDDTHAIMLCFSVDSKDSLENIESKWVGEIAENCAGVKLVLVALKCDLREQNEDAEEGGQQKEKKDMINYEQGLSCAKRINALRYLECSAMRNRGVNEAFSEAARVALSVKPNGGKEDGKCNVM